MPAGRPWKLRSKPRPDFRRRLRLPDGSQCRCCRESTRPFHGAVDQRRVLASIIPRAVAISNAGGDHDGGKCNRCRDFPPSHERNGKVTACPLRRPRKFSACLLIDRFNPLGAPRPRLEGITEVLRLAKDLSIPELHDTDSVGRLPIITDDIFGNPKIAAPNHAPNGEVLVGKQPPRRPDGEPTKDRSPDWGTPARRRRGRSHPRHRRHRPQTQPSAGPAQLGCLDLPSRVPVCNVGRYFPNQYSLLWNYGFPALELAERPIQPIGIGEPSAGRRRCPCNLLKSPCISLNCSERQVCFGLPAQPH